MYVKLLYLLLFFSLKAWNRYLKTCAKPHTPVSDRTDVKGRFTDFSSISIVLFCFSHYFIVSYLIYCGKMYSEKDKHKWKRVMWILTYGCCFSNLQRLGFFHPQAVNVLQWMLTCSCVVPDLGSGGRVWAGLVLLLTKCESLCLSCSFGKCRV